MAIVHVNTGNFEAEVMKADGLVLVDLFAEWCAPCKMLSPILAEIAEENPDVKVCKIDVDESPQLAAAFRASSIPMLVVVKGGQAIRQSVGFISKAQVLELLK
ncbi:MAG: thioredoxin [Ruminococcus sp.]|nr:thioredoxin [Ruminococcus sp.]